MIAVDSILGKYEPEVSGLGWAVREFLLLELNDMTEYPDDAANIIGYGDGPGYKNLICTIIPSKKGIKIGFYRGSELPDPKNLLEGTAKVHRHVDIKSMDDLSNQALKNLVHVALKAHAKRKMERR